MNLNTEPIAMVVGAVSGSCVKYSLSSFRPAKLSFRWQQHNSCKNNTFHVSHMHLKIFYLIYPTHIRWYFCQFQIIFIIVSSLASVAMMSPSESFADIKGDRFRFHSQALYWSKRNNGTNLHVINMVASTSDHQGRPSALTNILQKQ